MAKRFTDTDKWRKPWFRSLNGRAKMVWIYLTDNCDHAGFWPAAFDLLTLDIGFDVTAADFEKWYGERLQACEDKYFIRDFIEFQYGQLRDNNAVHLSVIAKLRRHGIEYDVAAGLSDRPSAVIKRLTEKRKREIYADDHYECTYCKEKGDETTLRVDHIIPRSKGGTNDPENLTTACIACNSRKSDSDPFHFIQRFGFDRLLSTELRRKLSLIKPLEGSYKPLTGAKDKDKNKEIEKERGGSGETEPTQSFFDDLVARLFVAVKNHPPGDESISQHFGEDWAWIAKTGIVSVIRQAKDDDFARRRFSNTLRIARVSAKTTPSAPEPFPTPGSQASGAFFKEPATSQPVTRASSLPAEAQRALAILSGKRVEPEGA